MGDFATKASNQLSASRGWLIKRRREHSALEATLRFGPSQQINLLFRFLFLMEGLDEELKLAAELGNVRRIQELIARGAKVNYAGRGGYTPLMEALWARETECVKVALLCDAWKGFGDGALNGNARRCCWS